MESQVRLGDIVHWKTENKKGKVVTKTGKVSKSFQNEVLVKSGRKEYMVLRRNIVQ